MSDFNFYPLGGMNTVAPDTDMVRTDRRLGRRVYARDLVNGRVDSAGTWSARPGVSKVSSKALDNLWYSERFDDTFATLGAALVKVNPDWTTTQLGLLSGDIDYLELNNALLVSSAQGLFEYNGSTLTPFTLADGFLPYVGRSTAGGLAGGTYAVALAFRRGDKEGAVSNTTHIDVPDGGGITVSLSGVALLEPAATHVTIYATHTNGGDLYAIQTVPIATQAVTIDGGSVYGKLATNRWLTKMPSGKVLRFWRGRLVTVSSNTLYFSESLNYHLHDPRTGYIQLPTRITFVEPVDNGLWVGQKNCVVFLSGKDIQDLTVDYKNVLPPVPWSSTLIDSELVSESVPDNGGTTACWLAANGYVLGTSDGTTHEMSAGVLSDVSAAHGQTVAYDRFLLTITN